MRKEHNLEEVKKNKAEVFAATDAFNWEEYEAFLSKLESIFNIREPAARENKFIEIWNKVSDKLAGPRPEAQPGEEKTSAMMMANLFESSFKFFSEKVPDDVKERIANAQLEFILNSKIKNEELKNICKGMWGYYVSPEKYYARKDIMAPRAPSEDLEYVNRRQEFKQAIDSLASDEVKSFKNKSKSAQKPSPSETRRMFYLTLAESGTLRFEGFENEAETIRYFADLYGSDSKPLAPIETQNFASLPPGSGLETGYSPAGGGGRERAESHFETGVQMPPHARFMNFVTTRGLPTDETIDADRVKFFMSRDKRVSPDPEEGKRVIRGSEKGEILVDILPLQFLIHYIQRLRPTRYTDDYREADDAEKTNIRLNAVRSFVDDLLNFNSGLWQQLNKDFADQPDLVRKIKSQVSTYDRSACYLAFSIAINIKDTEISHFIRDDI